MKLLIWWRILKIKSLDWFGHVIMVDQTRVTKHFNKPEEWERTETEMAVRCRT
jgi:hypothetical protein